MSRRIRIRINWDKSLTSFPPCYSQSPLQLCLEIFFLQTHATSYNFYNSITVPCEGERRKTWYKTIPPSLWFKKSIQKPKVWELKRLCLKTSTQLYFHELGFRLSFHGSKIWGQIQNPWLGDKVDPGRVIWTTLVWGLHMVNVLGSTLNSTSGKVIVNPGIPTPCFSMDSTSERPPRRLAYRVARNWRWRSISG